MIPLTLAEIAAAVGGRLVGADPAAPVTGPVEYDSRKVAPGRRCSWPSPGEKVDGHDFAAAAVAAGAVAVLGTREVDRACRWSWSTTRWPRWAGWPAPWWTGCPS